VDIIVALCSLALAVDVVAVGEAVMVDVVADGSDHQHQLLPSRQHIAHCGGFQELVAQAARGGSKAQRLEGHSSTQEL